MRFQKYWAREKVTVQKPGDRHPFEIEVCGGSTHDIDDARNQARTLAERVRNAIASGRPPVRYLYSDRPLREEVLDELQHQGEQIGAVTRNSYGSRVLNTTKAMFIDIDMDGYRNPATGKQAGTHPWFSFVSKKPAPQGFWKKVKQIFEDDSAERREGAFQTALTHIEQEVKRHSGLAVRVYRTYGGYRCLVTDRTFDPTDSQSTKLLERFMSDPLYIKLCKVQECYRARLTPKYWRCNGSPPPARFPFRDDREEKRYRRWQERYEQEIRNYSTSTFVASFGPKTIDDSIRPVIELHDRAACGAAEELA
ncbi:MAG: hypothetical protein GY906_25475 [bacterium]|nr:hypothetical protein [bacterium]